MDCGREHQPTRQFILDSLVIMKRVKHQDVSAERLPGKAAPEAKQLRKLAGDWLKLRRADAELSQADLAARLGLKYYTFISLSTHVDVLLIDDKTNK